MELLESTQHFELFSEFTLLKEKVGEPSPHLAIVGYLSKDRPVNTRVWYLACYGATYCLPSAQMIWEHWNYVDVVNNPIVFTAWIHHNWEGIITRTERRCVRTPEKMSRCLVEFAQWIDREFESMKKVALELQDPEIRYDFVWESLTSVYSIGRYIAIRIVEGLRRYCGVPAELYDIRSIGGWSPKRAMCYMYPEHEELLLSDTPQGEIVTKELAAHLLGFVKGYYRRFKYPTDKLNYYVIAAMLCEYRVGFENGKQYPGWTLDQEPLLYDKAKKFWGKRLESAGLWEARAALFPPEALGEISGWNGTRWDVARVLRDYHYNWSDLKYDYEATTDFQNPIRRIT